jgi:hypothetical protein
MATRPREVAVRIRLGKLRPAFDKVAELVEAERGLKPSTAELASELIAIGLRQKVGSMPPKMAAQVSKLLPVLAGGLTLVG